MSKWEWKKTLWKGVKQLLFFGLPLLLLELLNFYPELGSLTVGTLLTMFANWLKNKA